MGGLSGKATAGKEGAAEAAAFGRRNGQREAKKEGGQIQVERREGVGPT